MWIIQVIRLILLFSAFGVYLKSLTTNFALQTQLVEKPFSENVKKLKTDRHITIVHGMIRGDRGGGDDEDELSLIDENPIIVLMEFGHMNGFRLTDLFSVFDKDGSKSLDKSEIKTGLMVSFCGVYFYYKNGPDAIISKKP